MLSQIEPYSIITIKKFVENDDIILKEINNAY
jgi:hypothetical protein